MPRPLMHLTELARLGAATRLTELDAERAALLHAFPDLGRRQASAGRPDGAGRGARKRRSRPRWSAAQRQAVSDRMKKYWAKRKGAKK
jgi:hypothetical protein